MHIWRVTFQQTTVYTTHVEAETEAEARRIVEDEEHYDSSFQGTEDAPEVILVEDHGELDP